MTLIYSNTYRHNKLPAVATVSSSSFIIGMNIGRYI